MGEMKAFDYFFAHSTGDSSRIPKITSMPYTYCGSNTILTVRANISIQLNQIEDADKFVVGVIVM